MGPLRVREVLYFSMRVGESFLKEDSSFNAVEDNSPALTSSSPLKPVRGNVVIIFFFIEKQ